MRGVAIETWSSAKPASLSFRSPSSASERVLNRPATVSGISHLLRLDNAYPWSAMATRSELAGYTTTQARRALEGLPRCDYDIVVKPLRYRWGPHLAARCEFDDRRIVLQVPIPFRAFKEPVIYAARRKRGEGMRFAWASETVPFRSKRDVLRFLYCHEWLHWYLYEVLGKGSSAETACDRFALRNFRRRYVTTDDADEALKRRSLKVRASG